VCNVAGKQIDQARIQGNTHKQIQTKQQRKIKGTRDVEIEANVCFEIVLLLLCQGAIETGQAKALEFTTKPAGSPFCVHLSRLRSKMDLRSSWLQISFASVVLPEAVPFSAITALRYPNNDTR
jgi:hypothetical protein